MASSNRISTRTGWCSIGVQLIMKMMLLVSVLFLCICSPTLAFNIKTSQEMIYRNPAGLNKSRDNPDFFGYDFALSLTTQGPRRISSLVIGAPKGGTELDTWIGAIEGSALDDDTDPNKPGDLYSCTFAYNQETAGLLEVNPCSSISPVEYPDDPALMIDGDSFGLTVVKPHPDSPDPHLTACAPLRVRNCTSEYLAQGACYTSNDFGRNWDLDTKQASVQCPVQLIDLIFVLDGSGSVTASDPGNFDVVKNWVKMVAGKFDLLEFAHVGVIQYSHWYKGRTEQPYIKTEIHLGEYQNQSEFEEAVDQIEIHGYTTYTSQAINKTVEEFLGSERFNDTATNKVMILLTDGRSNDFNALPESAAYARSLGITIFAVGVAGYSEKELQIIATGEVGNNQRVYGLQRFSDLQQIVGSLQKSITGILEGGGNGVNDTNELQNSETGIGGTISKNACRSSIGKSARFYDN